MKSRQADQKLFDSLRGLMEARGAATLSKDGEHPSVSELASFFSGRARPGGLAAHVAACRSCAAELALYAQAERAASSYQPKAKAGEKLSAAAWQLIADWEESDFARPKTEGVTANGELLNNLARLVATRKDILRARKSVTRREPDRVPVVVINRSGEFRSVEVFERGANRRGEATLSHAEQPARFENVEIHALLYQDGKNYNLESYRVERGKARLGDHSERADFFIIEE